MRGWRQQEQVLELNTGQHRQRPDEHPTVNRALRISPHSSRSTSPVSQYAEYVTLDQWNVSDECQAAKSQLDYYPQWYLAGPARGMAASCSSSPFHRPWEEPAPQGAYTVSHDDHTGSFFQTKFAQSSPSMSTIHAGADPVAPQSVQQTSTPDLRLHTAQQPYLTQPCDERREISLESAHRAYGHPAEPIAQTAPREQFLMESINRMMSELQVIK